MKTIHQQGLLAAALIGAAVFILVMARTLRGTSGPQDRLPPADAVQGYFSTTSPPNAATTSSTKNRILL